MTDTELLNKYHFRGEKPKLFEGSFSKLARQPFPNENADNKVKYAYLYFVEDQVSPDNKVTPLLHCLCCTKKVKCGYNTNSKSDKYLDIIPITALG